MSKRKADAYRRQRRERSPAAPSAPDPALFITAHEADVVRGPRAHAAALALEVRLVDGQRVPGEGLIRWHGSDGAHSEFVEGEARDGKGEEVWVDRYDARLLLSSLPDTTQPTVHASSSRADSPSGWSDLPSDAEDTFFLSPSELSEYRNAKRRRTLDAGRAARLRALEALEPEPPVEETWASDEEPDDPQRDLMRRTATHLLTSPNRAQLEARILANHGADARFAFLRGRWARAWRTELGRVRLVQQEERRKEEEAKGAKVGLGALGGYGDSDDGEDEDDDGKGSSEGEAVEDVQAVPTMDATIEPSADDALKEARRARAREWAAQRKAAAASAQQQDNAS
ncbi:hypothetical protein PsYK624_159570 [Phanerochaete sordida]|uniref:Uncharacterized protein n=1 Tax=Phanerochaete sordida TaxID=48140 RepID=A0A9P3LLM8_9APHY|nr:hypothetical protein PsYK624_159570 [Phanerochaete sordida]